MKLRKQCSITGFYLFIAFKIGASSSQFFSFCFFSSTSLSIFDLLIAFGIKVKLQYLKLDKNASIQLAKHILIFDAQISQFGFWNEMHAHSLWTLTCWDKIDKFITERKGNLKPTFLKNYKRFFSTLILFFFLLEYYIEHTII